MHLSKQVVFMFIYFYIVNETIGMKREKCFVKMVTFLLNAFVCVVLDRKNVTKRMFVWEMQHFFPFINE